MKLENWFLKTTKIVIKEIIMSENENISIRGQLNEKCSNCDTTKDEADRIVPVSRGKWSIGPEWRCDECFQ